MKWRIGFGIIGAVLGIVTGLGGPDEVEAIIWPVTSETKGRIMSDDGREICWQIEFKKLRDASPLFFSWVAKTPSGERFYLAPYRPDGTSFTNNNTTPRGQNAVFVNCAAKPRTLGKEYTLEAFARYKVHSSEWLWTVPRRIDPFK